MGRPGKPRSGTKPHVRIARRGGRTAREETGVFERVWRITRQIPFGKVVTYGQIAAIVGTTPRAVGFAMAACPADVPWQRVVNSRGEVSARSAGAGEANQRRRLREEGVTLDRRNRVDLSQWGWLPVDSAVWRPPLKRAN